MNAQNGLKKFVKKKLKLCQENFFFFLSPLYFPLSLIIMDFIFRNIKKREKIGNLTMFVCKGISKCLKFGRNIY